MVLDRGRKPDSVCKHALFDLHSDFKQIEPILKNKKNCHQKSDFWLLLENFLKLATSVGRGGGMFFRQCF